jgi:predicted RNase H-like HicB family nuclease
VNPTLTVAFEEGEQGWWIATIPEIPGAVSQGRSQEEAREMVIDCAKELMAFRREEALRDTKAVRFETIELFA